MQAKVSDQFPNCISTTSLFAVTILSIAQTSVSIEIDCGSSSDIFAVAVLQVVVSFCLLIFRCWKSSLFQRSIVLIHSLQISLLIGWMVGYHNVVCRSTKMDILVAFSIVIVIYLFGSDVFICFKIVHYFKRKESNPSLTVPSTKAFVYDENDPVKSIESKILSSIVPLSFRISSPAEQTKSMNVATLEPSSTQANHNTSPLLRNALVSTGLASALGSMMHLHSLSGEYNFSKARGQDENLEDIELGFLPPERYVNNSSSWSVSRSMSLSDQESNKQKKRRTRRTIVLDGFRVNLKMTLAPNNGHDYIRPESKKFRNDLSMSMFRQLG